MGAGMGLAMAPATEAIMGALPKAKAGVGSAMNDVVREVGGTLGVAVLAACSTAASARRMDDDVAASRPRGRAATDSVGAAHEVAAHLGGSAGQRLLDASNQAFVDAWRPPRRWPRSPPSSAPSSPWCSYPLGPGPPGLP